MNVILEWVLDGYGGVRVNVFICLGLRDRLIVERYCVWLFFFGWVEKYRCEMFGFCVSKSLNGCWMG